MTVGSTLAKLNLVFSRCNKADRNPGHGTWLQASPSTRSKTRLSKLQHHQKLAAQTPAHNQVV